jgi:hypothetical protein
MYDSRLPTITLKLTDLPAKWRPGFFIFGTRSANDCANYVRHPRPALAYVQPKGTLPSVFPAFCRYP